MHHKIVKLQKYLEDNGFEKQARYIFKISEDSAQDKRGSTEIEFENAVEINVNDFNPFSVKGEAKVIKAKGPKQHHDSASFSINTKPVSLSEETTVYFIDNKYNVHVNHTMVHDGATDHNSYNINAFGNKPHDVYDNINFDFNKEEFERQIREFETDLMEYS